MGISCIGVHMMQYENGNGKYAGMAENGNQEPISAMCFYRVSIWPSLKLWSKLCSRDHYTACLKLVLGSEKFVNVVYVWRCLNYELSGAGIFVGTNENLIRKFDRNGNANCKNCGTKMGGD